MTNTDDRLSQIGAAVRDRTKPIPRRNPTRRANSTFAQVIDPRDHGAACDGSTNDWSAIKACTDLIDGTKDVLLLIPGTMRIVVPDSNYLRIVSRTTVRGVNLDGTTPTLGSDGNMSGGRILAEGTTAWKCLFYLKEPTNPAVVSAAIEDVSILRNTEGEYQTIQISDSTRCRMDRVTVDGQAIARSYTSDMSGFKLVPTGQGITDLSIVECTVQECGYGLTQDSSTTATVSGVIVDGCTFARSTGTDLEFNAPSATCEKVRIRNCTFRDNRTTGTAAGWGVGFANIQSSSVTACTFDGYPLVPIHLEDRTSQVVIADCRFANSCETLSGYQSCVFIVNATHHVTITGSNVFDLSGNYSTSGNKAAAVYVGPGGSFPDPHDITISPSVGVHYGSADTTLAVDYTTSGAITYADPTATTGGTGYPATL